MNFMMTRKRVMDTVGRSGTSTCPSKTWATKGTTRCKRRRVKWARQYFWMMIAAASGVILVVVHSIYTL